jgi:hypothetical protein
MLVYNIKSARYKHTHGTGFAKIKNWKSPYKAKLFCYCDLFGLYRENNKTGLQFAAYKTLGLK